MKTEKKIWLAFALNFGFSVFEFFGGMFTGSVAILSDAVHDLGDAVSMLMTSTATATCGFRCWAA